MSDIEFWRNEKIINERKEKKREFQQEEAKEKIKCKAKISIQTAAIGALVDFEKEFGSLWGHGKKYSELTPEEKKVRNRWMNVRNSILDRTENSKKILLRELDRCVIDEYDTRYVTIFKNRENGNGRENY